MPRRRRARRSSSTSVVRDARAERSRWGAVGGGYTAPHAPQRAVPTRRGAAHEEHAATVSRPQPSQCSLAHRIAAEGALALAHAALGKAAGEIALQPPERDERERHATGGQREHALLGDLDVVGEVVDRHHEGERGNGRDRRHRGDHVARLAPPQIAEQGVGGSERTQHEPESPSERSRACRGGRALHALLRRAARQRAAGDAARRRRAVRRCLRARPRTGALCARVAAPARCGTGARACCRGALRPARCGTSRGGRSRSPGAARRASSALPSRRRARLSRRAQRCRRARRASPPGSSNSGQSSPAVRVASPTAARARRRC